MICAGLLTIYWCGVFISMDVIALLKCVRGEPRKFYFIE